MIGRSQVDVRRVRIDPPPDESPTRELPPDDNAPIESHRTAAHVARSETTKTEAKTAAVRITIWFAVLVSALVLAGLVLTYAGIFASGRDWDASVSASLADSRSTRYEDAAVFVSRCGDTLPIIAFGAAIAVGAVVVRGWRSALFVPIALLIEVSAFAAINFIVQRPRPDVDTVGAVPSTFSYPSGHVAATLVCWFGLVSLLWLGARRPPALVVATIGTVAVAAMGWARVYLGMHHMLDVVAGVVMGIAALVIAARGLQLARHTAARHAPRAASH
jgi:undecaprenyl-diphosphatase